MLTNEQREKITAEAKSWSGTPYRGWSCVKGAGVDCGQYLYGVFRATGFLPEIQLPRDYSLQVSKHRSSSEYIDIVRQYMRDIPEAEARGGDVVLYKLGRDYGYSHAAIIIEWPHFVIHAEQRHGVCGAHGRKLPAFRNASHVFVTLRDEYTEGR